MIRGFSSTVYKQLQDLGPHFEKLESYQLLQGSSCISNDVLAPQASREAAKIANDDILKVQFRTNGNIPVVIIRVQEAFYDAARPCDHPAVRR